MRLWIDTDVGDDPDDAIALLCAAASPEVELVGVSTVDGDHERRAAVARSLVAAPVVRGDDADLAHAVTGAGPEALLAIGPLTNVARLIADGTELPPLTAMGGLLGTVRHWDHDMVVEHNFSRDPAAAATALRRSRVPLLIPLNVTLQTRLAASELEQLLRAAPALRAQVEAFLDLQRTVGVAAEERAIFLHDPLALLALIEPTVLEVEDHVLAVEADGRLVETDLGSPTRLAVDVDAPRAIELVLGLVGAGLG